MKVFRELHIRGENEVLRALLRAIEASPDAAAAGWRREPELELTLLTQMATRMVCFSGPIPGSTERALVWLREKPGCFEVANVVPEAPGSFEHDAYNRTLKAFHDDLIAPAAKGSPVSVELGADSFDPADALGAEVARLLRGFAELANRATGAAHPADNARWRAFVIAAHRKHVSIDSDLLERWLREECAFPSEVSFDLAARYENERALLSQFEQSAA